MTDADGATFEVLQPGLLTTIQDLGRPDAAPLGVPHSGACDPLALSAANLLAGNATDAAALEMSLLGPELRVLRPCLMAITGADFEASVVESGERLRIGRAAALKAGTTLRFGTAGDGARGYLAVLGGFDVPVVLGSRSTALSAGFGGLGGRALAVGDRLSVLADGVPGAAAPALRPWAGPGPSSGVPARPNDIVELRLVRGPHAEDFSRAAWSRFVGTTWDVDPRSDRMGVRLVPPAGDRNPTAGAHGQSLVSLPMTWGAVEMPPGGAPICLLADHPTVGGYPVIAVIASADLPTLGQLRPGHRIRFQPIELSEAQALAIRATAALEDAARRLGSSHRVDAPRG